ncbi:MAG: TRAP transporter small permease [Clostridiales bacterium]|nr:TRAP transporter small permease [Clostridiales bacterium]MCF8023684.1 TRAP transporter small permease [Clostridiales bacterium]
MKNKLFALQRGSAFVLMLSLPLLMFIQVLLRYVLNAPLMGVEELLLFPTIWLYMLGGANASMERSHITCGILTLYIKKEKTMSLFNIARCLVSLLVSLWLTYWALWYFVYSFTCWKLSNLLFIPMFFGESAVGIGLVLMTLYTVVELIDYIKEYLRKYYASKGEKLKC